MRTLIAMLLVALLHAGRALGQSAVPPLEWTRTLEDVGNVVLAVSSPTGACVAIATETAVHVLDTSGRARWTWKFHQTNRWIRVDRFQHDLAISPDCDTIVLAGASDYKYVWAANRGGRHIFLPTVGTPLSIKFGLRGDTIAIVTGASVGYLVSPRLEMRWQGQVGDLPVRWPSQSAFGVPSGSVEFAQLDVDMLFGALLWGWGVSGSVSDDGQWRVITNNGDPRGSVHQVTTIELWGPGAGGYRGRHGGGNPGRPRWVKPMGCPEADPTRDGAFVIVRGDLDHPDADPNAPDDGQACDPAKLSTYVFDRDGNLLLTWPPDGNRAEMAAAVLARTGVTLVLPADSASLAVRQWDPPYTPTEKAALADRGRIVAYSPDRKTAFVARDREVRFYRAPETPSR